MTDKKQAKVQEQPKKEEVQEEVAEEEEEEEEEDEDPEQGDENGDGDEAVESSGGDEKKKLEKDDEPFDFDETLKLKVTLSDGTEASMFSRGPKYADDLWPINCHLCRVGNLITEEHLKRHIRAKGHKSNLSKDAPDAKKYMEPFRQPFGSNPRITTPLKILPGEFITEITDDMKDRIIKKEDFQFKVPTKGMEVLTPEPISDYNKRAPIMGLCYAFKMKKFGRPKYFCALCKSDIYGEAYQHFVGANHQAEYVVKHFPKTYEKVVKLLNEVTTQSIKQKYIRNIFRKIYRKIETEKGNKSITIVDAVDFKINRRRYIDAISKMDHYNENTIEIPDSEIEEYVKKTLNGLALIKADLVSLVNPKEGRRDDGLRNSREERHLKRRKSPVRDEPPMKSRRDERRRFDDSPQAWDRYRRMIGAVLDDLDELYERYEREPERHPSYSFEWKKFWRNRCKELEKDNIDVRYYDFNKEWIPFWERRLQEYHAKDIVKRKFEMKKTLHLSYDARSPSPLRRRRPRRSPTPPHYGNERRYSSRRDTGRNNSMMNQAPVIVPNEPLSVISVMRLLTALEDQLGSLGPKAVQLLSRAVLSEKNDQNPNDLLMENDFHVFFMTAKEKLKGQLIANIVEPSKICAVKSAVTDLTTILGMFEEFISRNGGRNRQQSQQHQQRSHRGNSLDGGNSGGGGHGGNNHYDNDRNNGRDGGNSGYGGNSSGNQFQNQYSGGNQGGVWQSGAYRGGDNGSRYNDGGNNNQNSMPTNQNYRGGNDNENYSSYGSIGGGGGGGGSGGRGGGNGRMNQSGNASSGGYQGNSDGRSGYQQNQNAGSGYGSQNQSGGIGGSGGGIGYSTNISGYNSNSRNAGGGGYPSNDFNDNVGRQQVTSLLGSGSGGNSGGGLDLARNSSRSLLSGNTNLASGLGLGQKIMGGSGGYGGGGQSGGYNNRSNQMMGSQYNRGNDMRRY